MSENSKASDMTEEGVQKDKRGSVIKKFVGKRTKSTSQSSNAKNNTMSEFKNSKTMTVSSSSKNVTEVEPTKLKTYMDPRVKKENRRAIKSMILPRSPVDDTKEPPHVSISSYANGKEELKKNFVDQLPKRSLSHHRRATDMTTMDNNTKKPGEKPSTLDSLENTKKPFEKPLILDEPVRRPAHRPRAHRHSFHVGDIEKLNQAIEKENEKEFIIDSSREDGTKMRRVKTKPKTEEKQIIQDREPRKSNNAAHSVEKKINFLINPQKQESKNPQIKKINFLINSNGSRDESEDEKDENIPKIDIITWEKEIEKQEPNSDDKVDVQNLPRSSKSEFVLYKSNIENAEPKEIKDTKDKRVRTKSARIDKLPIGRHSDVKPKRNSLILRPSEVPNFFVPGRKDTQTTIETPKTTSLKNSIPENSEVKVTQIKDTKDNTMDNINTNDTNKRVKTHVRRAVSQDFALTYDKNLISNKPKGILRVGGPKSEKSGSAGSAKIALTQEEETRIKEKEGKPKLQRRSTRWIPPDYYDEKATINQNGTIDKSSTFLKFDQEMEEREKERDREREREKEREKEKDSESDKEQDKDKIKIKKKDQEKDNDKELDREQDKNKPRKKNSFIFPSSTPNKSKNTNIDEKYAKKRRRYSEIAFNRLKKSAGKKNKIEDDGGVKFTAQTKEKSPKSSTPIPSSKSVPSTPKCVVRSSPPSSPKLTNKSPLRRSQITSHQTD